MMRFFSFGGGIQSVAVLVMAARGMVQFDEFLMSNVGDDSENPKTLEYFREYALPFAESHNLTIKQLSPLRTLYTQLISNNRDIAIPAFMGSGAPGNRNCTSEYKIKVVARYIRKTYKVRECIIGLGISTDEIHRARTGPSIVGVLKQNLEYPLIDLRMSRRDCEALIVSAGLPIPPKSACWFCPFQSRAQWIEKKRDNPELFQKAVELEQRINEKRNAIGRDIVYLHPSLKPLNIAVGLQDNFFSELENCESGYCMV